MNREIILLKRIRTLVWVVIVGLVLAGVTALPLETELNWLVQLAGAESSDGQSVGALGGWLVKVRDALLDANQRYPFMAYGTDWLAFAHFAIAVAFVGALRDPVRNVWIFEFGLIACVAVFPFALVMGEVRGIPWGWRAIDCLFGVGGLIPLWLARRWTRELGALSAHSPPKECR